MIQKTSSGILFAGGNALKQELMVSSSISSTKIQGSAIYNGKMYMCASNTGAQFTEYNLTTGGIVKFGSSAGYTGIVAHPNGYLYAIPSSASFFAKIDPIAHTVTEVGSSATGLWGGCLAQNGKIYASPQTATQFVEFDPYTETITKFGSGTGYAGINLAANGYLYCIPLDASAIAKINPTTRAVTSIGSYTGALKYAGGIVGDNNKIYLAPYNASQVAYIDTVTDTIVSFGTVLSGTIKYKGLARAGNYLFLAQATASQMLKIDLTTLSTSLIGTSESTSIDKYAGAGVDFLGRIVRCPYLATSTSLYPTGYIPPSDAFTIPSNLADLPTSNYNKYFNKF